jgi:hypothetical protein
MPTTVGVNKLSIVHKDSGGTVSFMPDVCKTPAPPGPPVPVPYPNVAMSADADKAAKTVTCDGNPICIEGSVFAKSTGDEAGSAGGVVSGCTKGKAKFLVGSFDVQVEGKGVVRFGDQMLGNEGSAPNTPPMPETQAPAPAAKEVAPGELKPDFIELTVKDGAGNPLADVRYVLQPPDGKKLEGKTDASGTIKVPETIHGIGRITFPDLPNMTAEITE